jgi:NADH:ubiquinone oxidoreductase subunit H
MSALTVVIIVLVALVLLSAAFRVWLRRRRSGGVIATRPGSSQPGRRGRGGRVRP